MTSDLFREQYRRSEKARQRNKLEERRMVHDIESRNGLRAFHEYRVEMVTREQRKIAKELEKIRDGLRLHKYRLSVGPQGRDGKRGWVHPLATARPGKSPPLKSSKLRPPISTLISEKSKHKALASKSPSVNQSPTRGSYTNRSSPAKNMGKRRGRHNSDDDSDSDDDDDEDYDNGDPNAMPDPEVLKAILQGVVNCWEETVVAASDTTGHTKGGFVIPRDIQGLVENNMELQEAETPQISPRDGKHLIGTQYQTKHTTRKPSKVDHSLGQSSSGVRENQSLNQSGVGVRESGNFNKVSDYEKRASSRASKKSCGSSRSRKTALPPLDNKDGNIVGIHNATPADNNGAKEKRGANHFYGSERGDNLEDRNPGRSNNDNSDITALGKGGRQDIADRHETQLSQTKTGESKAVAKSSARGQEKADEGFERVAALQSSGQIYTGESRRLSSLLAASAGTHPAEAEQEDFPYHVPYRYSRPNETVNQGLPKKSVTRYGNHEQNRSRDTSAGGLSAATLKPLSSTSLHSTTRPGNKSSRQRDSESKHAPPSPSVSSTPRLPSIPNSYNSSSTTTTNTNTITAASATPTTTLTTTTLYNDDGLFYKNPKLHIYHGSPKSSRKDKSGRHNAHSSSVAREIGEGESEQYSLRSHGESEPLSVTSSAGIPDSQNNNGCLKTKVAARQPVDRDATLDLGRHEKNGRRFSRNTRIMDDMSRM